MKVFLLILIRVYWSIIPESKRRKCLFKVSCSNYVFHKAEREGLISGIIALRFRIDNCNSSYSIIELEGEKLLITKTNQILEEIEINASILK